MQSALAEAPALAALKKADPSQPAIRAVDATHFIVVGGTYLTVGDVVHGFADDVVLELTAGVPGADYGVRFGDDGGVVFGVADDLDGLVGGFHFAPGGNAAGHAGGDAVPAINPFSCWDLNFRPACGDPRGMTLIDGRFWADIYLLGTDHLDKGTSRHGETIADGRSLPRKPDNAGTRRTYSKLDFATAQAIMAHHGKTLLGAEDYFAAAFGVTERSAADVEPKIAGLDAPRTSKWGLMQAAGNMWVWGTEGDPDTPRASIFGGGWRSGSSAGSRCAYLDHGAVYSYDDVSARGRSDHLMRV